MATLRHMLIVSLVGLLATGSFAKASTAAKDASPVMPLVLRDAPLPKVAGLQQRLYQVIQRQAHYLLTQVHPWKGHSGFALTTDSSSVEAGIRPNTGMIQGLAFLYRFGPYDPALVGCDRPQLLRRTILPMMRYCVATHVTGDLATDDGKPWGDAWQSAYWAQHLGMAAWWLWDDLPEDVRQGVRRVVAHEADRFTDLEPPHQLCSDTKAEENAWNSKVISTAIVLMPEGPRRDQWERTFHKWVMSSYLRPADEHSTTVVDGRTVAEQFTGANVLDDFTLENHGIVHPDYMRSFILSLGCVLEYNMTGRKVPEALRYNVSGLYGNLKWLFLPDGHLVYPNGEDWELFSSPDWFKVHVLMAVFGGDPDAWTLANESFDTLEKMQQRYRSGMIYSKNECFFPSKRPDLLRSLAVSWLVLQQADRVTDHSETPLGVHRLDLARIILHRTPKCVNTFSWGARIMAMCVPVGYDSLISPINRSGIGHVRVAGSENPLPVHLDRVKVEDHPDGFTADAVVNHGKNLVRAELHVESRSDGTLVLGEKLVATADVKTSEVATGLIGVLNNPSWIYERGERTFEFDGRKMVMAALSGQDSPQRSPHPGDRLEAASHLRSALESLHRVSTPVAPEPGNGRALPQLPGRRTIVARRRRDPREPSRTDPARWVEDFDTPTPLPPKRCGPRRPQIAAFLQESGPILPFHRGFGIACVTIRARARYNELREI